MAAVIRAVLWDFGGVILTSPFEAFAAYERKQNIEPGFLRRVNATNPHDNAWAKLERGEVGLDEFAALFEHEARSLDPRTEVASLSGHRVIELLAGEIRPEMVAALDACRAAGLHNACLTNNITSAGEGSIERQARIAAVMARFDHVVESSKVGVRKPEPRFYEIACELLGVSPSECVFLDDLGINLKPARAMGMTTIKVDEPGPALTELSQVLGMALG
jgi:putative hydrolase of the HAD superfamily